jgi:hypothetical protein
LTEELSEDDVLSLLAGTTEPKKKTKIQIETEKGLRPWQQIPLPEQKGPVRQYDKTLRCANKFSLHARECGSPTTYKLKGIPYCEVHLIRKMNEMLTEEEE